MASYEQTTKHYTNYIMQKIDLNGTTILVSGGEGFIDLNLIKRLLKETE